MIQNFARIIIPLLCGHILKKTDPVYYGAIGLLMRTGAYGPANILVFVVLFPIITWLFIINGLKFLKKIKMLKNNE